MWRYGGTVRITSFSKHCSSSSTGSGTSSEIAYYDSSSSSLDEYEPLHYEQLLEFLSANKVSKQESEAAKLALTLLFDRYVLAMLQAYINNNNTGLEDLPFNSMVGKIPSL